MKRIQLFSLGCVVFLATSITAFSQTTPSDPNEIFMTPMGNGLNGFEVVPLNPSQADAFFSHLWWSGDNSFTFVEAPEHTHPRIGNPPTQYQAKMTDITTENYGTGGPPPLTYTFTTSGGSKTPTNVLAQGNYIYMQNYRNAVIDDIMYLIVSYGNSTGATIDGKLRFDVSGYGRVSNQVLNAHPHFLPNGEVWRASSNEVTFTDLNPDEERSVLIPVKILQNEEDELQMRVDIFHGENEENGSQLGIDYSQISASVAHSHDPNLMLESSDAKNQCDYRNGEIQYTIKFQNTGDGPTRYVRVVCQLDDKVDLNSISNADIEFPDAFSSHSASQVVGSHQQGGGAIYEIDHTARTITFEMHDLRLEGTGDPGLTNLDLSRDQIKFKVKVKSNYVFGPATVAVSTVYFDDHAPIVTNEVETICGDPLPEGKGGGFQKVKPTFWEKWRWYIISGLALIVSALGSRIFRKKR